MAADDYMQLRSEIKQKFYGRFENKESSISFATNGTIKEILSDEELGKLYDSLKCAAIRRLPENQQSFIKAIKNRMLYEFLAVLLFSECSLQAAEAFVKEMVIGVGAKDQRSRAEQPHYLPRTFDDLKTLFGDEMDARRFDEAQHRFCVIVVGHRDVVTIKAHDKRSLPWIDDLKEKPLGSGAYGVVRKVIIPPGHFTTDGNFGQFNSDRMSVALKSFTNVKSKKDFQQEVENILKILDSTATHKNILTSLAAIAKETESPSFYLLMPLAEMDLKSYMEKDPKMDVTFKASLISSAMGLADGLNFLHNLVYDSPDQSTICYHLDLKPDNVLLFKKHPGSSNDDAMIWKLSDFGISRIKIMEKEKKKEDLFNNPFKTETSQSGAVGASATHNVRGLSTFLPPEAGSQRQEMTEKSDIWSLGCIISVLFTYMAHGPQGVEQYSRDRMKQSNTPFDTFWQLRLITGLNINKAVSSKHKSLIKEAYERNTTEADAVSSMLEFLEEKVLRTDKQKRCTAGQIREKLRKTCEAYSPEQAAAGSGSNSIKSGRERIEEPATVNRWPLDSDETTAFDGCDSSLDGRYFAYWNAQSIVCFDRLFAQNGMVAQREQNGRQTRMPFLSFGAGSTETPKGSTFTPLDKREPDSTNESWKAVRLTGNHLVAISTTNGRTYCYVFRFAGERKLNKFRKVTLPADDFHFLSVCQYPDTLICLLSNNAGKSFLWRAVIGMRPLSTSSSNCKSTESSSDNNTDRPHLKEPKKFHLRWPASEIIHIVLQTHDICYIVVREHNKPLNLSVYLHYLKSNTLVPHHLELLPQTITRSRLFDDMACFAMGSSRSEAIMVTHSDQIWHFKSEGEFVKLTADQHERVHEYYLRKIATCQTTGRILALGTYTGSRDIVLLHIQLRPNTKVAVVKKVAKLDGLPKDVGKLHIRVLDESGIPDERNRTIVLVMAVRPAKKDCVYTIDL